LSITDPPPIHVWSWAWDIVNVWVWPLLDEVCLEIPPAGGDSTSDFWIVIVWVWALTLVEVNIFEVDGGGGVVEPEHLDWTNAARAPNDPNSPVTRKFFLVMLTSFKKRRADFPFFLCAYPIY
jgi:hypothetical protein